MYKTLDTFNQSYSSIRFIAAAALAMATVVNSAAYAPTISCSSLVNVQLGGGIEVLSAVEFGVGDLVVPSYSGGTIDNAYPLCQVSGNITYGADDVAQSHGDNTLTWQLYLPDAEYYNGRFMVVGKGQPFLRFIHTRHVTYAH